MTDYKKEPLTAVTINTVPKLIRVVAPANLPGGYQLEVQTDTEPPITFTTNVPPEGVKTGDVFLTLPPPNYTTPEPQIEAPTGRWKDGLCDCFAYGLCHAQTCMSIFCTEIALGQIMQRMRLTWTAGLVENYTRVNTFKTVLTLVICYYIFDYTLYAYLTANAVEGQDIQSNTWMGISYCKEIVGLTFSVWSVYALCKTRQHVRTTYSIPNQYCSSSPVEDCCLSAFCSCCVVGQIGRHTGDYDKYPTLCCSETGLPDNAPMVV
jgi:Cys-rich protein (TIGR01571 family)